MAVTRIAMTNAGLVDLNDGILTGPEPTHPTDGLLWLDESVPTSPRLKKWNGSSWVDQQMDLKYLDPTADGIIEDSKNKLADMANDSILTQTERIQVLNDLIAITGTIITDQTTTLPTAAQIDVTKKGTFYHTRQQAINAGLSPVHIDIDALEDAYLALTAYLNPMNPKPWNVWVDTNLTGIVGSDWRTKWLDYYNAQAKLIQSTSTNLSGRVTTTEGNISDLGDAISLRVTSETYEDGIKDVNDTVNANIGRDKWIAKRFLMTAAEGNTTNYLPGYASVAGKTAALIKIVDDVTTFRDTFGAQDNYIGYFATALYVEIAKNISFTITHNDGCRIYLNGSSAYTANATVSTATNVTLSLNQGWNLVEILYAEQTGTSSGFTFSVAMKTLVDKVSCYGMGDAIGGRMTSAESSINVQSDKIDLVVTSDNQINGESIASSISVTPNAIGLISDNISFSSRGEDIASSITVTPNAIQAISDNISFASRGEDVASSITLTPNAIQAISDNISFTSRGDDLVSEINLQPNTIKIASKNVDINGAVTFSSLDSSMKQTLADDGVSINNNPQFINWTGTYPDGYSSASITSGNSLTKTTETGQKGNIVKFTVAAATTQAYLEPNAVTNYPYVQYVTVQATFKLESGTIDGSGILFRYNATSNVDHYIKFKDIITSPTIGKWYTVTKVIKQASSPSGFAGYAIYPMGAWTAFGTVTTKVIHISEVITRPSTEQEINAYETKGTVDSWKAPGKTTINGGQIEASSITLSTMESTTQTKINNGDSAKGTVDSWKMTGKTTINGGQIETDTVTATQIYVDDLSAISANIGIIEAGEMSGVALKLGIEDNGDLQVWADTDGDGTQEIVGRIDNTGGYFPYLKADKIEGNIITKYSKGANHTFYFDVANGNDSNSGATTALAKKSLQQFINSLPKDLNGSIVTIRAKGSLGGTIYIEGFRNGKLQIAEWDSSNFLNTNEIRLSYNTCFILLQKIDVWGRGGSSNAMVYAHYNRFIHFYDVKVLGGGNTGHGFWMEGTDFEFADCHIYNITDRGLYAYRGSTGTMINCYGNPPVAVLSEHNAWVGGYGSRWSGSLVPRYAGTISSGEWSSTSTGTTTPTNPTTPSQQTITVTASTGDNYSSQGFWTNDEVKQGNWGYGARYGLWYFDLSAIKGKTVVSATLTMYRNSGGTYAARTAYVRSHPYSSRSSRPASLSSGSYSSAYGVDVSIGVGQTVSANVTNLLHYNIANGSHNSLGIWDTSSTNYMNVGINPSLTITYS